MSSAEAIFALVAVIEKHSAELSKVTIALENQTEALHEEARTQREMCSAFEAVFKSITYQRANIPPQKPPDDPNKGPLRPIESTPSRASIATSGPWKENQYGHWIFANENQELRDSLRAAPDHTLVLNGMKYKLSGNSSEPEKFINRNPLRGKSN